MYKIQYKNLILQTSIKHRGIHLLQNIHCIKGKKKIGPNVQPLFSAITLRPPACPAFAILTKVYSSESRQWDRVHSSNELEYVPHQEKNAHCICGAFTNSKTIWIRPEVNFEILQCRKINNKHFRYILLLYGRWLVPITKP